MRRGPGTRRRARGGAGTGGAVRPARWLTPEAAARWLPLALGLLLYGPWLRPGWMLGYDWASGPHDALPADFWGLSDGRASLAPEIILRRLLRHITFGIDPVAIGLTISPLLVAYGYRRLLGRQRVMVWLPATVITCVNPFVHERLASGAFGIVFALSALPLVLGVAVEVGRGQLVSAGLLAIVTAGSVAFSPQALEFDAAAAGVGFLIGWLGRRSVAGDVRADASGGRRPSVRGRPLVAAGLAMAATIALIAYWLLPSLLFGYDQLNQISQTDLSIYATRAEPHLTLVGTVLSLYGFFRRGPALALAGVRGWPEILAALAIVVLIGLVRGARAAADRPLVIGLVILGFLAVLTSMGGQGPTGSAFRWLYMHSSVVRALREPQKALQLLVIAYGVLFGLGSEALLLRMPARPRQALMAAILIMPCLYSLTTFLGLEGAVRPAAFPASWQQADATMSRQPGTALFLPWHEFLPFRWTAGRTIDNPARYFFAVPTLTGDNIEAWPVETESTVPRSHLLQLLFTSGRTTRWAGRVLAPLGVRWVLLDHDADFQTYKWLDKQADLRVVHRWPDLTLYENTERTAPGWFPFSGVTLPDWGALIGAASQSPLTDYSITVSRPAAGPARPWRLPPTTPAVPALALDRKPYKEELEPAGPVHGHPVGITTTLSSEPGWRIDSRPAESWAGVTIAGRPAGLNVAVRQGHWTATFISELASLCALVLTVVGVAAFTVRSRRRSSSG